MTKCFRVYVTAIIAIASMLQIFILHGCSEKSQKNKSFHKVAIIQLGTHDVIDSVVAGFERKMKESYGGNATITKYNGNFDMNTIGIMAKQMVASDADILVSVTTPASGVLIGSNRGLHPLVFTFVSQPKEIGYTGMKSLKNTTGLSDQVDYKRTLKMIRLFMPKARKIGYLLTRSESNALAIHEGFQKYASEEGFKIVTATIGHATDIRTAAESLAPNVDLFLFGGDNEIASAIDVLINTVRGRKLPIFACDENSVEKGAVAAYSVDYNKMGDKTAEICIKILNGENPEIIPLEVFNGTRLIINEKSAREVGILIPSPIYSTAEKIIK